MRVIEQLEGVFLNASVWGVHGFPGSVRDYQPSMLDELISSSEWCGSVRKQVDPTPKKLVRSPSIQQVPCCSTSLNRRWIS